MEEIKKHIDGLPIELQPIYKALRTIAKKGLPDCVEMLYHNSLGYSLTDSPWDRICYIAHQPKGYINFGFFFGADIPDPTGLIQGKGKRLRHVKIYTIKEAKNPDLEKLVAYAWNKASIDIAEWRQSLKRKSN